MCDKIQVLHGTTYFYYCKSIGILIKNIKIATAMLGEV